MKIEEHMTDGFELSAKMERLAREMMKHCLHAKEKHPFFACEVSGESVESLGMMAEAYRVEARKPWADVHSVLASEVYEFLEVLKKGDYEAAEAEMLDVVAVMLRALDGEHTRTGEVCKEVEHE